MTAGHRQQSYFTAIGNGSKVVASSQIPSVDDDQQAQQEQEQEQYVFLFARLSSAPLPLPDPLLGSFG
jgi:hypothetical protein